MTKKIFVLDFYNSPLDEETLNSCEEVKYSVGYGDRLDHALDSVDEGIDALLVEPRIAFYSPGAKKELSFFLSKMINKKKFPILLVSTDKLNVINQDYGLEEGKHYDKYFWKVGNDSLEEVRNTLDSLLK